MSGTASSAERSALRVAVVGTGRMGAAMAVRLGETGSDVVALYNRTRAKADAVAARTGFPVAGTAREAVAQADVVLVSLGDDDAVLRTYEGDDGLAAGLKPGTVVVETSTVDPATAATVRAMVEPRGAALLDAPVSGSVPLVEKGELTFMAGGDPAALEDARPVLELLAKAVFHVGTAGTGAAMKLAVNAVILGLNQVLSEALVLAETAGIDRSTAYDVFTSSAVAAPFVHYKRAAFEHPDKTPVAFSLELVRKDLSLITGLAEQLGVAMDQTAVNHRVAEAAVDAGLGDADMSALAAFIAQRTTDAG
ncbi:NAD(P)-dependent oxidoreductase [Phytoactinopolyspora mesophila]|uniref:NAD-binding protein n=1 Tax=Phytoactinopolyspora mesophila TaxID=2650750 RepID=A0A7K3LYZ9_9ACTN|nr:NAD(P)-dependent oxidoreductase [Phytoactinopolyspora mesophila]NDL56255.1 NAD-binding protein [Phytoactinopolyspora mesophila]